MTLTAFVWRRDGVARLQPIVSEKVKQGPVKTVNSRLGRNVYLTNALILRRIYAVLELKLLHGIE
jgi:hypothetical protein